MTLFPATKTLRPYQAQAVDMITSSKDNLLLSLPTGAGKTVIASEAMKRIDGTCVFIVPRIQLLEQAREEFGDVDVIWSNKTKITGEHIIVASRQSMDGHADCVPSNATFIFDEVHDSLEDSYSLVERFKPARVLGLTATPERMDGYSFIKPQCALEKAKPYQQWGIFDRYIPIATTKGLIDMGYLSPLHYFNKHIDGIENMKPDNVGEWSDKQVSKVFDDFTIWGDLVKEYEKHRIDANGNVRPALGFTKTIAMAKTVAEQFKDAGYNFYEIDGEMSRTEQQRLIKQLANREIDGLVNAALLTVGFDCPVASYAFLCRGVCSRPLWFQIVGRILRCCKDKQDAIFVDHTDTVGRFSSVDDPLPILNPSVDWHVEGLDGEAMIKNKQERKEAQKHLNEVLDIIDADMVEVTSNYITNGLMGALDKKNKQIAEQTKKNDALESNNKMLSDNNTALAMSLAEANDKIKELRDKANAGEPMYTQMDSDDTFDFIKCNYSRLRRNLGAHTAVAQEMLNMLHNDGRAPDFKRWNKSLWWWEHNYEEKA